MSISLVKVFTSWLTIPSLRAMAWEAVTHYNPDLELADPGKLLAEGVPMDCIDKVAPQHTSQQTDANSQADWG